ITGAARGIGRALLTRLAYYDVEIIAADRDAEQLGAAVREPSSTRASLNPFVCNVATQSGVEQLFAHALATLSGVDIFIAAAEVQDDGVLDVTEWASLQTAYSTNAISPVYAAVKMTELNPSNPYLTVLIASAYDALAGYAVYRATKGSLHLFAEAYRTQMPGHGQLMVAYPGVTQSDADLAHGVETALADSIISAIEKGAMTVYPSWSWRVSAWMQQVLYVINPRQRRRDRRCEES
ncbi:MAG: SDR family oxidoreductase, partial [Chloroflexota bacterium]